MLGMSVKENMSLPPPQCYFSRSGGSLKHKDEQQAVSDIRLFNVKNFDGTGDWPAVGGNQQKVAVHAG